MCVSLSLSQYTNITPLLNNCTHYVNHYIACRHNGVTQITAPIRCDAVPNIASETMSTGESLQRRLMELSNINHEVNVRSVTPDSGSLHDHLYVRHWLVTFNIPRTGISRHVPRLSAPMPTSAQGLNHPSAAVTIVSLSDILTSDRRGINGRFVQREVGGDGMYVFHFFLFAISPMTDKDTLLTTGTHTTKEHDRKSCRLCGHCGSSSFKTRRHL